MIMECCYNSSSLHRTDVESFGKSCKFCSRDFVSIRNYADELVALGVNAEGGSRTLKLTA